MKEEEKHSKDSGHNGPIKYLDRERFFGNSYTLSFMIKKAERISAALYLLSAFFETEEPLKWRIRTLSVELVERVTALSFVTASGQQDALSRLIRVSKEIRTILEILHIARMVSTMNYDVLVGELEGFDRLVPDATSSQYGAYLEKGFFEIKTDAAHLGQAAISSPYGARGILTERQEDIKDNYNKGHINKKTFASGQVAQRLAPKNSNRREVIVATVRKNGQVTIKDISSIIKDCSEKTLQRELLAMVEEGLLKKEGERRWSRYSLRIA